MISLDNSMPHKGEKRRNYTMEFKRQTIKNAVNSNHKASEKFHVAIKWIREWRQDKLKIFEPTVKPKNKRLEGGGRKPLDLQLENQLVEWIYNRRSNGLHVSRKLIMAKTKHFYKSECDESDKSLFMASNGWVNNFMHCNGFLLHCKTTTAQQDPQRFVMDETSIWNNMVSNTAINKQGVYLRKNRHEKCMICVCLAAKADGTKLKPFVVFCAAKRESKSLGEEFKSHCVVKSSSNT